MVRRCSSIRREQCALHPECIESVTHRFDKVFLGTAQFSLRGALLTSRDAVAVIEVTITGPNARAHSSRRCCTRRRFAHETLGQLASRVDERRCDDVVHELTERYGEHHPSVSLLRGVLATEDRERSSIWSTTSGLFAGVRTEAARASSREAPLDLDAFLSGPHQLHIVAPSRHQAVTIPLVVGLIEELVHATYDRHEEGARLLLALDELANVAPLPRLASIVSEGGGQGVLTLACLQDLSQARSRWGTSAEGFLSLFPTTVVLPGIADRPTLEMLRHLAGRSLYDTPTYQFGRKGKRAGRSTSWVERDRAIDERPGPRTTGLRHGPGREQADEVDRTDARRTRTRAFAATWSVRSAIATRRANADATVRGRASRAVARRVREPGRSSAPRER